MTNVNAWEQVNAIPQNRWKVRWHVKDFNINQLLPSWTADSSSAGAERGEELWTLATHTGSTCQLVFQHSQGLVCLSVSVRVRACVTLLPRPPSTLPLHLLHLLFLPQPCPSCSIPPITAASIILKKKKKNAGPFYSCTCDCETHSKNFLTFPLITASRQRLHHGEKAEISYIRYTCVWHECQILSQWQPIWAK